MPKTLHLTLTFRWWEEIASGRKKCEYRRFCHSWIKRIGKLNKGDKIVFHRGYSGVVLTRVIEKINVVSGDALPPEVRNFFSPSCQDDFFEIQFK